MLKTACYKQGEEFYLSPWNDIFQELYQLSERENQAGGAGEILEQFLNGAKAEEGKASRMTYPMVEKMALDLLQALSKRRRILLVFDDIQWMDSMSGQLLNRVLLRLGRERLLLLCSMSREGEGRTLESLEPLLLKAQVTILRLEPFTREETDELIRKTLPDLASEEEKKAEIYRATDGNAFFLRELLTLIREKGYTLEKSKKTNYVIQARLSGLSRQERETLGAMAVFPGKHHSLQKMKAQHSSCQSFHTPFYRCPYPLCHPGKYSLFCEMSCQDQQNINSEHWKNQVREQPLGCSDGKKHPAAAGSGAQASSCKRHCHKVTRRQGFH